MAFQWVFDNASAISMNNRAVVGQSVTRNNSVRSVSRGNAIARFTVEMPDGMRWSEVASYIAAIDAADRFTVETVELNNANYTAWMHNGPFTSGQTWDVICVELPEWNIFANDQVSWSGPFVFFESIV